MCRASGRPRISASRRSPCWAAAAAAFGRLPEVIEQGRAEGELAETVTSQVGIVLLATMQGIATLINGGMVEAEMLDELTDQAVEQFLRGNRPG